MSVLATCATRADPTANAAGPGRRLPEALQDLMPEQEEVLVLRFILGYGGAEVAGLTERTLDAVKALQHRGLASLVKLLASQGQDWR